MLERRGAVVFDADTFARHALDPGTPGYLQVLQSFGPEVLTEEGDIDREALATTVFGDADARLRLEAIVHPEVARGLAQALLPYRETDRIIVYSVPLLFEAGLQSGFDVVVTVSAPEEARIARLGKDRGMSEQAARDRIRAQWPDERREALADHVIRNDGSLDDLERAVDGLWLALERRMNEPP
jgi:dephospho-CoA kinase